MVRPTLGSASVAPMTATVPGAKNGSRVGRLIRALNSGRDLHPLFRRRTLQNPRCHSNADLWRILQRPVKEAGFHGLEQSLSGPNAQPRRVYFDRDSSQASGMAALFRVDAQLQLGRSQMTRFQILRSA